MFESKKTVIAAWTCGVSLSLLALPGRTCVAGELPRATPESQGV